MEMFENCQFANASLMLEVLRGVFEKYGMTQEAKWFRSAEANSIDALKGCLHYLETMESPHPEVNNTREATVRLLRSIASNCI